MNAFGFFLRRLAWQFGIRRERARWNAVTHETQILSEAQDLLGRLAWPNVSGIEELTGEYWQLRDMDNQQAKLREESESLIERIESMQSDLNGIEAKYASRIDELRAKKTGIMDNAAQVTDEMDEIRERDQATRQRFASLKRKLDVLKRQEGQDLSAEIEKTRTALVELKKEHDQCSAALEAKENEVAEIEGGVQEVDEAISQQREEMKRESSDLVAEIGRMSKRVADLSAKIGALENSKTELAFQVGQYLSNNADSRNPEVQKVLRPYRSIMGQIGQLRKSIQFNQRLARRSRA